MKSLRFTYLLPVFFALIALPVYAQNRAPVANSASYSTDEDVPLNIRLSATDTDGPKPIKFKIVTSTDGRIFGFDEATGDLVYSPNPDKFGTVTLVFVANDSLVDSAPATISITVTPKNDPPLAVGASYTIDEKAPFFGGLKAYDVDFNPGPPPTIDTITFRKITDPSIGSITSFNPTTGAFTYLPSPAGGPSIDSFTFVANDGTVDSLPRTVFLNIRTEKAPVASAATITTLEDEPVSGTLSATDPDNSAGPPQRADPLNFRIVTNPSIGRITYFSPDTGVFTYTPFAMKVGSDSFTFVANDGKLDSTPAAITLTITPTKAPVAIQQRFLIDAGNELSGTLSANHATSNPLTFRRNTGPAHGTVTITADDGTFTYKPTAGYHGADSFTFVAREGTKDSEPVMVSVTTNAPPKAQPITLTLPIKRALIGQLQGADDDGDTLTYLKTSGPSTVKIEPDGRFTYNGSEDSDSFEYTVSDGRLTSPPATVTLKVSKDATGFIGDTLNPQVTVANFLNGSSNPEFSHPDTGATTALDMAVDRANQRLYVLSATTLKVFNIGASATNGAATLAYSESVNIGGAHLALALDGRTLYIGSTGKVTAINIHKENVYEGGDDKNPGNSVEKEAYTYRREFPFAKGSSDLNKREVAAMGVHPAGDRLFVVIDMDALQKKLNINNNRLRSDVGNGIQAADLKTTKAALLPDDFGFITQLEISADVQTSGTARKQPEFAPAENLKTLIYPTDKAVAIGIKNLAFSPDGNCAFLTAVGAGTPRATAFGIMPTSDEGTGGIIVLDVRPRTASELSWVSYLGFIPTTEKDEKTEDLRREMVRKGFFIVHPDVSVARSKLVSAQGFDPFSGTLAGSLFGLDSVSVAVDTLGILEQSYQDYGYMEAYSNVYPHDMVGASSVAFNHTGDFGVITMQDTNNLGLLSLSPSDALSGYTAPFASSLFANTFYIKKGTGKTINKLQSEGTVYSWAYPQKVAFTSDDSRVFIGMAGGIAKANPTNKFGSADAFDLLNEMNRVPSFFNGINLKPGYFLYGTSEALKSPRQTATFPGFNSDHDLLSDQLKAYNRWNSLKEVPNGNKAALVSTDAAHIVAPGKPASFLPGTSDSLGLGYLLPPSGVGYRLNTFGQPLNGSSFATKDVVTTIEQLGLEWDKRYHDYLSNKPLDPKIPSPRPYFIVGLLTQPGGGLITNLKGEALSYNLGTGLEVNFPYFTLNSDLAHDFVTSNITGKPTVNTGETTIGFDVENTKALIQLLLAQSRVKKIELDPMVLDIIKLPAITNDPRIVPHGMSGTKNNSRRDMDNHMLVTFGLSMNLDIDSDNNGLIDKTTTERSLKNQTNTPGKIIWTNDHDQDGDGIPNYADGYDKFSDAVTSQSTPNAGGSFIPMIIQIPAELNLATLQFQLVYSESDPNLVTRSGASPNYTYSPAPNGALRVWSKDGSQARKMAQISGGGDFIKSNTPYSVAILGFGTDRKTTVYIESVAQLPVTGKNGVTFELILNAGVQSSVTKLADTVRVTPAQLRITNANGPGPIPLYKSAYNAQPTDVLGELNVSATNLGYGTISLKFDSGADKVTVYESAALGALASPLTWAVDAVPAKLYVKGIKVSTLANDVKMKLVYTRVDGPVFTSDIFNTTVFDIKKVEWVETYSGQIESQPFLTPGGGSRLFPDKQYPEDWVNRKLVGIRCEVVPAVKDAVIHFKVVDVDDPSANSAPVDDPSNQNDNRGATILPAISKVATNFYGQAMIQFEVSMQPGDNYKAVACLSASLSNGLLAEKEDGTSARIKDSFGAFIANIQSTPTSAYGVTDLLTVWRRIHIETDSMGPVVGNVVTGNIISVSATPSASGPNFYEIMTDQELLDSVDRFQNGKLTMGSNQWPVAYNTNGKNFKITYDQGISGIPVTTGPFSLVDDDVVRDLLGNPLHVTAPDLSYLATAYGPAYIEPIADGGGLGMERNNNSDVPFKVNINALTTADTEFIAQIIRGRSSALSSPDLWILYAQTGFETHDERDHDPSSETVGVGKGAIVGLTDRRLGHFIFQETTRDSGFNTANNNIVVAHEFGHLFRLPDVFDNSIMNASKAVQFPFFLPYQLDLIRRIDCPQKP